jgi:uncharacterized protein involved in response to NO
MPIPRLRADDGLALLSYGFRPFFLFGALYAAVAVLAWLPLLNGEISLPSAFTPRDWHVHEMIYGYVSAVVTGFLLTAIPNWTGRLPIQGGRLLTLLLVWAAGRLTVLFSAYIGWMAAAIIDCSFLLLVCAACLREIVAGRNWRNLKVLLPVSLLFASNLFFHVEAGVRGTAEYGARLGLAALLLLIMLIGGRVIPSFTRNWLTRENPGRLPVSFATFDAVTIAFSAGTLALWIARPIGVATSLLLAIAGVLQFVRLSRWAGDRTTADRLVLVLHVAYAFLPVGFVLSALAALGRVAPGAGIHAWTAGAIGLMTLAMMTRATLGHTGHALVASWATQGVYAAAIAATLCRICAALHPAWADVLLVPAGIFWIAAFAGYVTIFSPMLLKRHP